MAKGRKSKAATAASKKKDKKGATDDEASSKVSSSQPESEKNDLVRVLGAKEREGMQCSIGGCTKEPITAWTDTKNPENPWHACEDHQEKLRGLPEGVDPPSDLEEDEISDGASIKDNHDDDDASEGDSKNSTAVVKKEPSHEDMDSTEETSSSSTPPSSSQMDIDQVQGKPEPGTPVSVKSEKASNDDEDPVDADEENGEEPAEEEWTLTEIYSEDVILSNFAAPCDEEGCSLKACVRYRDVKSKEGWSGCLDCQDAHFGGWSEDAKDYPPTAKPLSEGNKRAMVQHCTLEDENHDFSKVDAVLGFPAKDDVKNSSGPSKTLTPIPASHIPKVTPPAFAATLEKKKKKKQEDTKAAQSKKTSGALAKWQIDADKLGGGKIVVSKPDAKKLIFDTLYDAMQPKNISDIHSTLKAKVPASVLKSCLDDMAALNEPCFDMSDDEDDDQPKPKKQKKASSDPYFGTLSYKAGKTANSMVYYVDHNKTKNNGIPDPEEANELQNKFLTATEEAKALLENGKSLHAQAAKLEAQPTNAGLTEQLAKEEPEVETLREQVNDAQGFKVNGDRRKLLLAAEKDMVDNVRKRRILCENFVVNMSEYQDAFGKKNVWWGDGPVYIEGDAMIVEQAKEMAAAKKNKKTSLGGLRSRKKAASAPGITGDPNFIAVNISSAGTVSRVYLDE